jgi:hypothetical protein
MPEIEAEGISRHAILFASDYISAIVRTLVGSAPHLTRLAYIQNAGRGVNRAGKFPV